MSAPEASNPPTTEASLSSDAPNPENATIPPVPAPEDKPTPEREAPTTPLPSDDALLAALRDILKGVDFHTVTQGQVRAKLEEHFGQDLSEKKAFIRENLPGLLAELKPPAPAKPSESAVKAAKPTQPKRAAPSSDETDALAKKKGRGMFGKELLLSPGLAEFMGETHMSRSEATKRVWAYIREHNLPKTKNKSIQLDDALEKALRRKTITFGSLAKALAANMKDEQHVTAGTAAAARPAAKSRAKAPSSDDDDDNDGGEEDDEEDEVDEE